MKFKYAYYRYKAVSFSELKGKTIKAARLGLYNDLPDQDFLLILKMTTGERYLLSDYPTGRLTLYASKYGK
jgi:hypothetical protein